MTKAHDKFIKLELKLKWKLKHFEGNDLMKYLVLFKKDTSRGDYLAVFNIFDYI